MTVYDELCFKNVDDLKDICWSGAIDRIDEVLEMDEDKQDEFIEYLKENLGDEEHLTTTELNDFIWFECDGFIESLKDKEEEDEED